MFTIKVFYCIVIETSAAATIQFRNTSGITAMTGVSISDNITVIPEDVPCINSINASISAIIYALGLPDMPTRILTGAEIGLPVTPEEDGQLTFDKNLNNEGYKSSGELGPL